MDKKVLAAIGALVYGSLFILTIVAGAIVWHNKLALDAAFLAIALAFISFVVQAAEETDFRRSFAIGMAIGSWLVAFVAAKMVVGL